MILWFVGDGTGQRFSAGLSRGPACGYREFLTCVWGFRTPEILEHHQKQLGQQLYSPHVTRGLIYHCVITTFWVEEIILKLDKLLPLFLLIASFLFVSGKA